MHRLFTVFFFLFLFGQGLSAQSVVSVTQQEDLNVFILSLGLGAANVVHPVRAYKMNYTTTDPFGNPTEASGLISLPYGVNLADDLPIAVYNHGTVNDREAVPSRVPVQERFLAHTLATQGYITIAPDYLGLGDNPGLHPYVHAESEAQAGYDMILALREWLTDEGRGFNDQIFTTGYSQGGHSSMALQQKIQEDPTDLLPPVTAAAHLSGPYSISTVMAEVLFDPTTVTLPGYLAYTYISYNYVYGLFDDLGEVFVSPYAEPITDFSNEVIDLGELNSTLFALLDQEGDDLPDMFQDSVLDIFQNQPAHPINAALRDNDTYNFAPDAPTLLVYCTQDEQVPFGNALFADSVMTQVLGSTTVETFNNGPLTHGQCVPGAITSAVNFFNQFTVTNGVFNTPLAQQLSISPNPVNAGTALMIQNAPVTGMTYDFTSLTGQKVLSGQLAPGQDRISTAGLQSGMYLLTTQSENGLTANKIIVQ